MRSTPSRSLRISFSPISIQYFCLADIVEQLTHSMPPTPLTRTSSTSSVASDDTVISFDDGAVGVSATPSNGNTSDGGNPAKRTRKRFTNAQLVALEQAFHQTSHPTREQREAVAKDTGLELRSVTVWFQNKRQTERKIALCYGSDFKTSDDPHPSTALPSTISPNNHNHNRPPPLTTNASYQRSVRHSIHAHRPQLSAQRRPSLDSVASRSERPQSLPKTPTRLRTYSSPNPPALWENMPSSPLTPSSPDRERGPDREFVDFGKRGRAKRTLEWACAAARVSGRRVDVDDEDEEDATSVTGGLRKFGFILKEGSLGSLDGMETLDFGGDTEDESEAHEAVTPNSSLGRMDMDPRARWAVGPGEGRAKDVLVRPRTHDEEMVNAALVLCGLGKR